MGIHKKSRKGVISEEKVPGTSTDGNGGGEGGGRHTLRSIRVTLVIVFVVVFVLFVAVPTELPQHLPLVVLPAPTAVGVLLLPVP